MYMSNILRAWIIWRMWEVVLQKELVLTIPFRMERLPCVIAEILQGTAGTYDLERTRNNSPQSLS